MIKVDKKIDFQTEAEAQAVRDSFKKKLVDLSIKYNVSTGELIEMAKNDEIEDISDLFLVFRSMHFYY